MSWLDSYAHRALLEAALLGAVCGAIGLHVLLRQLGFFAMAMTHATFPGVALATMTGFDLYLGGGAAGVLGCLCVVGVSRRRDQGTGTATGIMLAAGFALGVALLSASNGFNKNLEAFMTGSLLTVSDHDLATTAGVGAVVLLVLGALHKEFVHGAFDPEGQRAAGYPVVALELLLLLLVEAVIVVTAPAVGVMLAMSLIIGPAATARLWTDRIGSALPLAAALGVAACVIGLEVSIRWDMAAGGTITLVIAALFLTALVVSPHGIRARVRRPQGPTTLSLPAGSPKSVPAYGSSMTKPEPVEMR
ncbi:metal ABC transporter permease [Streptomyces sp. WAC01526]|uniref:metal ABC transporter permease n=1 Tax=Streptomyces sp. WAC01526 TaxID=2588709 RepID=UPI0011DF8BFA|nr:metal ABC transporter permease [Streptomyces sp. WAC01526]MCW7987434.1 hypothetical protein [Streptomyces platensis subsp. clarensis]